MLRAGGEEVLKPLAVMREVCLEGAGVGGVNFCRVASAGIDAGVDGSAGSAREEEGLGAFVVAVGTVGGHRWIVVWLLMERRGGSE